MVGGQAPDLSQTRWVRLCTTPKRVPTCHPPRGTLTGSIPNGYGPRKTPVTLGSRASKGWVARYSELGTEQGCQQGDGDSGRGHRGGTPPPGRVVGHGGHAPGGGEDDGGFAEALVVDEAGVDGEGTHEQDEVAPLEECQPNLGGQTPLSCPTPPPAPHRSLPTAPP